jgi:TrmH family RNA methyltransferase
MVSRQQIKRIRSLHLKKFRDELKLYLAEGLKLVEEVIINQPQNIEKILFTTKMSELFEKEFNLNAIDKVEISEADFQRISTVRTPQGILAVLKKPQAHISVPTIPDSLILALDRISNPGNLGTIIRLADWFGITDIICSPDTVECYNPKVVQATMGALFRMNLIYTPLEDFFLTAKKNSSIVVYGTSLMGSNIYKTQLQLPAIIVLGNEATGISKNVGSMIDHHLMIPNFSHAAEKSESLNVSVAAAIVCSEFRRQSG